MAQETPSPRTLRLAGCSFLAFVLAPETSVADWLEDLDAWIWHSPGFFAGRPVILDLSGLSLTKPAITRLLVELVKRKLRVIAVEGVDPSWLGPTLGPLQNGDRSKGAFRLLVPSQAGGRAG